MGWLNINGNWIGRRSGGWRSYWKAQSEVLFFGLYSEIADGKMPNKKSGSTDYLTVSGSAGSETYQCPNTAAYIAADTDFIWFKQDETQRTTTTAELIGYDLQRTPVKYLDDAPNSIEAIMILSSSVTGTKRDKMFQDFHLPIMWDNSWNDYGREKSNRALEQILWTPEVVFTDEYQAVYDAMATKPSDADAYIQNTMIKALVDRGIWAKTELFPFFGTDHDELMNWKNPGTYTPTKNSTPAFEAYAGYTGSNILSKWINLNYIPSVNASLISQNSITVMIGVGTDLAENYDDFGAITPTPILKIRSRTSTNTTSVSCNASASSSQESLNSKKYFTLTRGEAATYNVFQNKVKTVVTRASTGLPTVELIACGGNSDGTKVGNNKQIRFVLICSYLTDGEVESTIDIMEAYFDNYSKGLL